MRMIARIRRRSYCRIPTTSLAAIMALTSSGVNGTTSFGLMRSEEHTSELQSPYDLVCRLLLEKKKQQLRQRRQRCQPPRAVDEIVRRFSPDVPNGQLLVEHNRRRRQRTGDS